MVSRTNTYVPERGDVVWISLDPQSGHEQSGRRPALVLSPIEYNEKSGLVVVCPITSKVKGHPFEVALPPGLAVVGVILADQIKNLDWRTRNAVFISKLPDDSIREVVRFVHLLLQEPPSP